MKTLHFPERDASLFILFGLTAILLGWFFFVLTLFGFFVFPAVLIGSLLLGSAFLFLLFKFLSRTDWTTRLVFSGVFLLSFGVSFFAPPTLFSGRDQGAISEAAIRLVQNGELAFRFPASEVFFDLYGPGLALNFPGFAYTENGDLITQFPLAYISWLGGFYSLFGLVGLTLANSLLFFLFLTSLYQLFRHFTHPFFAVGGLILASGSFLPLWFVKFTLTENLAVFLFTFLALCLSHFHQQKKFISYLGAIFAAGLFAFTRIEGYAIFGLTFLFFLFHKEGRLLWKTYPWKSFVLPGLIFLFLFLRNFFMNLPYYKMIGKALVKFLGGFGSDVVTTSSSLLGSHFPVGGTLVLYGVLPLFLAGTFGILILWREKKWILFLPLFLALPTLLYLFAPNITLDHPWMLRRYYFSLFPTFVFLGIVGFALLLQKHKHLLLTDRPSKGVRITFSFYIFFLLLLSFPAVSHFAFFKENTLLLPETKTLAEKFTSNDLILIDRQTTGSGYALPTAPLSTLFGRQAVYFFNPEDLSKIDYSRFAKVYLLVPEENIPRYAELFRERMIFRGQFTFTRNGLKGNLLTEKPVFTFPTPVTQSTKNILFQVY